MCHDTRHSEGFGEIPPQGDPQADRKATLEKKVRHICLTPAGVHDGGGRIVEDGYLRLLPPEQSCTIYCNQGHYGPVSGRGVETRFKDDQSVLGARRFGCGGDADVGSGGRTDVGGGRIRTGGIQI